MADSLLLRLPRAPRQHATWLLTGGAGTRSPESGPLELAAQRAAGRQVTVLVPGAEVLLVQPELPAGRSGVKLQQLVPYALEEQLAEDLDALHFAIGHRSATRTPVAVVARAKLEGWLAELKAAGIEPVALYADSDCLPENPSQAVALLEDDSVTLRMPSGSVLMLPADALGEALEASAAQTGPEARIRGLVLYTGAAEWARHSAEVERLRDRLETIQVQLLSADPLVLFARQLPGGSVINLLQGPYAPVNAGRSGWQAWRLAAVLLAAVVALHLIGQGLELASLKHRNRQLDAAIDQVFHAAMPGTGDSEEARRRMEQRLQQVRAGEAAGGFLDALGTLASARAATPGTRIEAVSFGSGELQLKLSAPSIQVLEQLTRALARGGWQANLVSSVAQGPAFEADIRMSRGS